MSPSILMLLFLVFFTCVKESKLVQSNIKMEGDMEKETIIAIYGEDHVEDISPTSYRITIIPAASPAARVIITLEYTESYPYESPIKASMTTKNISPAFRNSLQEIMASTIDSMPGEPVVFQLCSTLDAELSMAQVDFYGQEEVEEEVPSEQDGKQEGEGDDDGKVINWGTLPGEPITAKSFAAWWPDFRARNGIVLETEPGYELHSSATTGRQIWEAKLKEQDRTQ
eukprot:gnl/Dysnectes_brevis/3196_a3994_1639.p1 GENE.gnl/Dysnectes_brevis/3196_a3994_1639~~gnl/Dysnectes_brevis/3196_a3994_1639.p1  ORF type:complete len:227 (+),score=65.38 gnl/Dysnectes_brevis/3196_a3994_1639:1-681(+)